MKVLHVVKTSVGALWVYHQVRVLCSLGINVTVGLPSGTEGLAPRYKEAGATVIAANLNFGAQHPGGLLRSVAASRQLVAQAEPDLIHVHHVGSALAMRFALGKRSRIPRLFQVPGPLHLEHRVFARLETWPAGPPDYWIATCRWTREKYLKLGIPSQRVFLSYAGTDLKPFTGVRSGRLRKELGISAEVPLVGMIAYMYAPVWFLGQRQGLKGHEDFIAALKIARQSRPDLRGVIVGGPWGDSAWYEARLRRLGASMCGESLAFVGYRSDVPVIYPDLDLAVVASHSENCGGAVEPLLSGVPVVATNVGGLPDLIEDRRTGWLVPPGNPEALARAMLEAVTNREDARRRAAQGGERARCLFDVERVGRQIAGFYEQVLAHAGQPGKACSDSGKLRKPRTSQVSTSNG
jgi:glycosyltransferase involved in cell wall biosynthesis